MRLRLKMAVLATGKTQRQVSIQTGIPENRLSDIVRGWTEPTDTERAALAANLCRSSAELFPEQDGQEPQA